MSNNNRSWVSSASSVGSSASRDQEDESMDQLLNTSTSSKNNRSHQSSASRGGDRYNHYRRDAPARVKPWMRDKGANSGSSSGNANAPAGISNRVSRFRGSRSNSNHSTNNNSFGAAGTLSEPNSCANSVCSTSSFSDTAAATLPTHQRRPSFPQEVHQVQVLPGNQSLLLDESSVTGGIQYTPEEAASQSSRSGTTDQAVRPNMQENAIEKEGSSSVRSDQHTENTEGESTDESPVVEEDGKRTQQHAAENDRATEGSITQPDSHSDEAASTQYLDEKKLDDDEDKGKDDSEEEEASVEAPAEEFYDVLASVQPSSYNPMAATPSKQQQPQPVSVAAYATLNKPTPLATEQAALLNDAIVEEEEASEEEEEEEPSLVDDDDDDEHDNEQEDEPTALEQDLNPVTSQDENFIGSIVDSTVGYEETNARSVTPVNAPQASQVEVTPEAPPQPATELASVVPRATIDETNRIRNEISRLEESNAELLENIKLAGKREEEQEIKHRESMATAKIQLEEMEELRANMLLLEKANEELLKTSQEAETTIKEQLSKNSDAALLAEEKTEKLQQTEQKLKELEETNADLSEKLKVAAENLEIQQTKNTDTIASSELQAEMMNSLGEELKSLEQKNTELQQQLKEAQDGVTAQEAHNVVAVAATSQANEKIKELNEEIQQLKETNASLLNKIRLAEEREKRQASRDESITLVHVGDMTVDLSRLRIQCQKYFSLLRIAQLKSHCVRDKSPANVVVAHSPKERHTIDIQALLDKGAAIEAQDATYLFRSLDTFNKGHFHTHKLLIPWKITSTDGTSITRSEFFSQAWQQLGNLKVTVGEKKTVIPLFQDCLGTLIPTPNAVLEGKLQISPAELERTFAARIAPYYRAVGRLIFQCIAATADDDIDYSLKMAGHVMPPIMRQKLLRGVDPTDSSYPMDQLLDHAFSLLGMPNMTEEKAFEYFGIDVGRGSVMDKTEAETRVRDELHEMWINERSLALKALEEGLTLNGLADISFCCGLVPLEAVDEIFFSV